MDERSYDQALKAINDMYGDTALSREDCLDNLEGLRNEIDILIEALET